MIRRECVFVGNLEGQAGVRYGGGGWNMGDENLAQDGKD